MRESRLALSGPDGEMAALEVVPHDPRGAVIVIHEAFGLNDHIADVTRRVAASGHHGIAPDLFHRGGGGTAPYDDFSKAMALFAGLDDDAILADVDTTLGHLHGSGWDDRRTGIVGFCFGGRATFLVSVRRALGAAVGFYGGGIVTTRFPQFPALIEEAPRLQTPWLGIFGDEDESIPVADVEALRTALGAAPVAHDVVRYPDAGHGFHCDVRPAYRPGPAADAWRRAVEWMDQAFMAARTV
ncbi:MAG: dienelactone hydrolase family protein [Acidimicrobiales bacterium]